MRRWIEMRSLLRFAAVGAVGFVVDAGVLQVLLLAGWSPVPARSVAIPIAVLATWLLNRAFTFRDARSGSAWASLLRYAGVSALGALVNFGVYSALVLMVPFMARQPLAALAVASVVALLVNYLGSRHFAFRPRPLPTQT